MKGKFETKTPMETANLAKKVARSLRGGEVIGLTGDLGAGKTMFAKGLAIGLGVKAPVNSPTFVVMKIYDIATVNSRIKHFCHIDAYRLKNLDELSVLGAGDYMGTKDCVVLIEWADRIKEALPIRAIWIKIRNKDECRRIIEIS